MLLKDIYQFTHSWKLHILVRIGLFHGQIPGVRITLALVTKATS